MAGVEVVGSESELSGCARLRMRWRDEEGDDRRLGIFLRNDERVRERSGFGCHMRDKDRFAQLYAAWDVDKSTVAEKRRVECGEFCRTQLLRLSHKMGFGQIGVVDGSSLQRHHEPALRRQPV